MATSATGHASSGRLPFADGGFTLLEIVVVVAIISVLLVMVRISLPDRPAAALALEARRFVQTLHDCRDSAVVSGAPAGIRIWPSRYELQRYRGEWQVLDDAGSGGGRELPVDLRLSLRQASPERAAMPEIVCLPTGETALPAVQLFHSAAAGFYEFRDGPDGDYVAAWVEPPA